MFAIRYYGMWIRKKDGRMTSDKERAMLFDTLDEAEAFVPIWKVESGVQQLSDREPIELVEVACKKVISKVGSVRKEI